MVAEPYTWVSFSEARARMPQIWNGWSNLPHHANRAMVNALRRGDGPVCGEAQELGSLESVRLETVIAGLLSLAAGVAEYETTGSSSGLRLGGYQTSAGPVTRKKSAVLIRPELAWEPFRDDLIRRELPTDATLSIS